MNMVMFMGDARKVLFITLTNIGDAILTMPAFSTLRRAMPDARFDVITGPRASEIFLKDPRFRNVYIYEKNAPLRRKINFIRRLRRERYDLSVDMRNSMVPFLIGVRRVPSVFFSAPQGIAHKQDEHFSKLNLPVPVPASHEPPIFIPGECREKVSSLFSEFGFTGNSRIIVVSHSARSPLKTWGCDGFIELIKRLLKIEGTGIVLVGDKAQTRSSAYIKNRVDSDRVLDLTGETSLTELFAVVEKAEVLITCDSAVLHIASALGIKTVAIFGPTDYREYGPRGKYDIVVRKDLRCAPCKKAICRFNHECMRLITADEVYSAVASLIPL